MQTGFWWQIYNVLLDLTMTPRHSLENMFSLFFIVPSSIFKKRYFFLLGQDIKMNEHFLSLPF